MTRLEVWIGCMHCFNTAEMVGRWYPADSAASVTIEQVHRECHARRTPHCEELWCYDTDGFPASTGEMSPATAQQWGEAFAAVDEHLRPAFAAWIETGAYVAAGNGDVPDPEEFVDHFQGEYESFEAFADQWLADTDYFDQWPEAAQTYFDHEKFARDLEFDFTVAHSDGAVFVFSNP